MMSYVTQIKISMGRAEAGELLPASALLVRPGNFDGSVGALVAGARAGTPIKQASADHYALKSGKGRSGRGL